jgi:DNA-directed RNA polymerase subunit RPC12/RpoP
MKIINRLWNTGPGLVEIMCECGMPFYLDLNNTHNNGMAKCPKCPAVERLKDLPGLYFIQKPYNGQSNWECGRCEHEFIFHDGDNESEIWCPNCHHRKPTSETTQEILVEESK